MNSPQYTDAQLQLALAKMLPDELYHDEGYDQGEHKFVHWRTNNPVLYTEWLHVCWLVEQTLTLDQKIQFVSELRKTLPDKEVQHFIVEVAYLINTSWQQRATALAKVKGVEIV